MKSAFSDSWFQMFAAVAGVACVVSLLGTVTSRHSPAAAPPAAANEVITPAPAASSSDLATYSANRDPSALVMGPGSSAPPPPASAPDSAAPKMTLTGTGVGNTQGIVGSAPGGMGSLISGLLGRPQAVMQLAPPSAPLNRVVPARKGVFKVGPYASGGADTTSLRDAVYSADDGDLVLVEPGVYDGQIFVAKKSVRVRGTGKSAGEVKITWSGPGGAVVVRDGGLTLENLRVERGPFFENARTEPAGAVSVSASAVELRRVELDSGDLSAPPLIVDRGGKPSVVSVADSGLSGSKVSVLARGEATVKFTRVYFRFNLYPVAAWLDAKIVVEDCRFSGISKEAVINAYEGATASVKGRQKPRVNSARPREATSFEDSYGGRRPVASSTGFARDIFRRGRSLGSLP